MNAGREAIETSTFRVIRDKYTPNCICGVARRDSDIEAEDTQSGASRAPGLESGVGRLNLCANMWVDEKYGFGGRDYIGAPCNTFLLSTEYSRESRLSGRGLRDAVVLRLTTFRTYHAVGRFSFPFAEF